MLNCIVVIYIFQRSLELMQVFERFARLVYLLKATVVDIMPFTALFISWVLAYGLLLQILGIQFQFTKDESLGYWGSFFISVFKNSIGESDYLPYDEFWSTN